MDRNFGRSGTQRRNWLYCISISEKLDYNVYFPKGERPLKEKPRYILIFKGKDLLNVQVTATIRVAMLNLQLYPLHIRSSA